MTASVDIGATLLRDIAVRGVTAQANAFRPLVATAGDSAPGNRNVDGGI